MRFLLSCEHAGNHIPEKYRWIFEGREYVLKTHRALDIGAVEVFHEIKNQGCDFSIYQTLCRLLIEMNRSAESPSLYSEFSLKLSNSERKLLFDHYYQPYRKAFLDHMHLWLTEEEQVLHLSVHSFTPELGGEIRDFDIGLLFDPEREAELTFSEQWKALLSPCFEVRFNKPYLGIDDGVTSWLRSLFEGSRYLGIEIEINQKLTQRDDWEISKQHIVRGFLQARDRLSIA